MWSGTERLGTPVERCNDHSDFTEMKAQEVKGKAVTVAFHLHVSVKTLESQHTKGMRHCTPNRLAPSSYC